MQTIVMNVRSALTPSSVLEAMKIAREKDGKDRVKFVELQFAPDVEQGARALAIAHEMIAQGYGVALRVDWGFLGTTRWAIQTENARVVNEGLKI